MSKAGKEVSPRNRYKPRNRYTANMCEAHDRSVKRMVKLARPLLVDVARTLRRVAMRSDARLAP
jgi:hypothetical protein